MVVAVVRSLLVGTLLCLSISSPALAAEGQKLKVVAHWRMGDDDADAAAGAPVKAAKDTSKANRALEPVGAPTYADAVSEKAQGSKLSVHFDGTSQGLSRKGLGRLDDNFVIECFARAETEEGFRVIAQYGSGGHGYSIVRNGKGYQLLIGGVNLVGWTGDVPAGEWVHLAFVRDKGVTRFFRDGNASGESTDAPHAPAADAVFSVGTDQDRQQFFGGDVDEVRVSTFPPGTFDARVLMVNDPDGTATLSPAAAAAPKPKAAGKAGAVAAGGDASITFDAEPIENGMTFERNAMQPAVVEASNGPKAAWRVQQGSAADVPWARSVLIKLTDPKLREGNQPVVDVTVEYRQTFDSPVELRADTESGSRKVGGGWGRNEGWQTFTVRMDDAYFGARNHGNKPSDMHTDGYDLRINSFGGDFEIRSVSVKAYDLRKDPDFNRLVRFDGIESAADLLIFAPGSSQTVGYTFSGLAFKQADLTYKHEIIDHAGKVRAEAAGRFAVPGRDSATLDVPVDAAKLDRGPYRTRLTMTAADGQVLVDRTGGFVVAEDGPVARAKPGEFLYGLDLRLGASYDSPRLLRWAQFMGADIIRHGFAGQDDLNEIAEKLPVFEEAGLGVMLIVDPPKDQERRVEQLPAKLAFIENVARQFPQIKFMEMGNEPDLTYFYPGPIENYIIDFEQMSDAARKGNPDVVVLNGGLAFAGAESEARSRTFVEQVDGEKIGAWAYHGHGPGERAESSALNRMRDIARAAGKVRVMADTESGVAAKTPQQEVVQARTVVQKMVYAQSEGSPFLMFFRLLMFEEAYGMLYSEREPRPSVASYANLVRTLRGHAFDARMADLPTGVKGYLFKTADGAGRAAVLWGETSGTQQVQLKLAGATKLERVDLYGNRSDPKPGVDGSLAVDVGPDPIYLTWAAAPDAGQLAALPLSLQTPAELVLRDAGDDVVRVTIASQGNEPVKGTLRVTAGAGAGVAFAQPTVPVDVPAGGTTTIELPVAVAPAAATVDWPRQWTCFVDVNENVDITALTTIPNELPGAGGSPVEAKQVVLRNDRINFEELGGRMREKAAAVVVANVRSELDQDVTVGASADWWMQWAVNGKEVYTTIPGGNGGGYTITDHTFTIRLKKGDNLIAVKQLSGSMGWKLLIGSPARLLATTTDTASAGVTFDLEQPGRVTQSTTATVRRAPAVAAWSQASPASTLAEWATVQPDVVLLDHVTNRFAPLPDATKWWRGPDDLSARGWVRQRDGALVIALAVADDAHHAPAGNAADQGDALRLRLQRADGTVATVDVVPNDDGTAANVKSSDASLAGEATVERAGETTFYQVTLTPAGDAARPAYFDATVFDQDDEPAKQFVTLAPASPAPLDGWYRLVW